MIKTLNILAFLIFIVGCKHKNKEEKTVMINDHQSQELNELVWEENGTFSQILLQKLFNPNADLADKISWNPTYEELYTFGNHEISTQIDTVFEVDKDSKLVLFLSTNNSMGHAEAAVTGLAYFKKENGKFKLEHFSKNVYSIGSYGGGGIVSIDSLAGKQYLKVENSWVGGGTESDESYYFDIESFKEVFSLETSFSAYTTPTLTEKKIKNNLTDSGFDVLVFEYEYNDGKVGKLLTKKIEKYEFNERKRGFELICK